MLFEQLPKIAVLAALWYKKLTCHPPALPSLIQYCWYNMFVHLDARAHFQPRGTCAQVVSVKHTFDGACVQVVVNQKEHKLLLKVRDCSDWSCYVGSPSYS